MGKLSGIFLIFLWFQILPAQNYAPDTLTRYGFSDYKEAADTLWARLAKSKLTSVKKFTVPESRFIQETRKHDTDITLQMIHGEWLMYWYHVEKSYKKLYNQLKKEQLTVKKAKIDTILLYKQTGDAAIQRAELYFVRNKKRGYIRFYLWEIDDRWYFIEKFEFVDDPMPVKVK